MHRHTYVYTVDPTTLPYAVVDKTISQINDGLATYVCALGQDSSLGLRELLSTPLDNVYGTITSAMRIESMVALTVKGTRPQDQLDLTQCKLALRALARNGKVTKIITWDLIPQEPME